MTAREAVMLVFNFVEKHPSLPASVAIVSIMFFVASIIFLPALAAGIPEDYFLPKHLRRQRQVRRFYGPMRILVLVLKNLCGLFLLGAGLVMLFIPGQGLLTVLVSLFFLNFPGKRRLELYLIRRPALFRAVNALRRMRGKPSLLLPDCGTVAPIQGSEL